MASFSTKTKAIILSTLLICNKYSTIGDKITFFELVYAKGMGVNILLPTETILDLKMHASNLDNKELTKGKSIASNACDQATINLENIERILKNHINDNQIASLSTEFNKKFASEHVPRTKILDNMLKAIQKLEDTKKTITLEDLKKLYMLTLRFKNKIYRNSEGNSQSNTLTSVRSSNYESESESENENDDFLQTARLCANVGAPNVANTNASTSESDSTDPIYANVGAPNVANTNASTSTSDPTGPNSQGPSTTSNPSSSESETDDDDDVIQKDKTTTSSNYWNNKTQAQTQSSDSNAQSTAKDDTESDINDDNLTPASQHVFNNNIETRYDMNNNNLNQFTAISDSTNQGVLKQQIARGTNRAVSLAISRNIKLEKKVEETGDDVGEKITLAAAGSFCSRNIKILKRYELEAKYLYSTTTTPKTNSSSKSNVHGLLINFKRQITSKLTTGLFYSPIVTNTISINTENNNKNTSGCMDHLFGAYTSYAITPVTHLSNQISFGIAVANNKSSNEKHHSYFVLDSFISHKINIDATKIISPVLGISYYQSNMHPHSKVGETKNLSLDMGVKLQYKYKYNNFDLSPSIKINHVHPLYDNTTGNTKDLNNRGDTPPVDLLRDQQSAFDPYSSVHFALSVRHKSIRFESGYGFTSYHNIEHSYAHTFFAKLNLYL